MTEKQGKNQGDLQKLNRSLVMRLIHKQNVCSRTTLARETGLTKASITGITQQLINAGVVKEVGLIDGSMGRRSIGLTLEKEKYLCIGVRLTRRSTQCGLFNLAGELHAVSEEKLFPHATPQDAIQTLKTQIDALLHRSNGRQVLGIGIALPGPIICDEDKVVYMSAFPGWEHVSLRQELSDTFHLPVLLEHDGVCYAMSEWWNLGPGDGKLMLCVLVGQGVGAGIVQNGIPIRGAMGCAGEIGHMTLNPMGPRCDCGNRGCLEHYCSTLALERDMALALDADPSHPRHGSHPSHSEIFEMVRQGDVTATTLFVQAAQYLAYGLVNVINFLNPDVVVVTDEMAELEELLEKTLMEILQDRLAQEILKRTRLVIKPGGRYQAIQSATTLIIDQFLSQPFVSDMKEFL